MQIPDMSWAEIEKRTILAAVKKHKGDMYAAAGELGIGTTSIYRKYKNYGLGTRRSDNPQEDEHERVQKGLVRRRMALIG
jgi:two-component system response regulator HydG